MPPVPKVALASPGACSPARPGKPADRRRCHRWAVRPQGRGRRPRLPKNRRCGEGRAAGMRRRSRSGRSQSMDEGSMSAVTAAFVASVTWRASRPAPAPPERVQATQLSTVPKQSSPASARARSGSTSSRMAISLVADAFGASRMPSACRTRHVPTVRRSCQPMPGATGLPVARSHTMVDALWLAMPTASTGPPSWSAVAATSRTASAITEASNSTRPGAGESGSTGAWCTCVTDASGRTTAARTPEVPTSTTRTLPPLPLTTRGTARTGRAGRVCPD